MQTCTYYCIRNIRCNIPEDLWVLVPALVLKVYGHSDDSWPTPYVLTGIWCVLLPSVFFILCIQDPFIQRTD